MTQRTYGQYCGIARGLELVGERWAMLIVRDLLGGPKRYTDLHAGLPGIPTNVLASRLKEMENNRVIYRRAVSNPKSTTVYELTPYGRELEDVLLRLGRWGAQSLDKPDDGPGYIDPAIRALRRSFNPLASEGLSETYELWFGEFVITAHVEGETVTVEQGQAEDADLVIDVRGSIIPVLSRSVSLEHALDTGRIHVQGDQELLERFLEIFRMRPQGVSQPGH